MTGGLGRVLYQAGYALVLIASPLAAPFSKKLRQGLRQRLGLSQRLRDQNTKWGHQPYWIHFASSGEFEQALPIAEEIKRRSPHQPIFFSYFSPSAARGLALETERRVKAGVSLPWDYADYCPLDFYPIVKSALKQIRPKALILINREIWPELILQCTAKTIPCFLFVSYFPIYKVKAFPFWRSLLKRFQLIGVVGESTAQLLKREVPNAKVAIIGDTRIERVLQRRSMPKTAPPYSSFLGANPIFLCASVWPEDVEKLKPALEWLATEAKNWRVVLVPHEPEEPFVEALKAWGKGSGLPLRRFTHFLQTPDESSHLIIDRVGELAELYQFSKIAFVGGSFKKRIHNVLEPAAYGNAILTGPLIENSFEATEMNALGAGLKSCQTAEELKNELKSLVTNTLRLETQGKKAYQYLSDRTGAAKKYTDKL